MKSVDMSPRSTTGASALILGALVITGTQATAGLSPILAERLVRMRARG